jgi:hypothetical protein
VLKALEKQPSARFQTVEELRLHLNRQGTAAAEARSEPTAGLPTLILPPRPEAVGSAATMETDRPRLPEIPSPPASAAPPPLSSTSYRPVEGRGWKRGAIAALLLVALAAAGILLWARRGPEAPVPAAGSPTPLAAEPEAKPATNAVSPAVANSTAAAQPLQPAAAPRLQERPKPASPPPSSPAGPHPAPPSSDEPAPAPQRTEPAPSEPVPSQETPGTAPEVPPAGDLPAEELSRLGGELVAASEKLGVSYAAFLEQKEDGGAELTEDDEQLQEELELVQPGAEVRQDWQEVRRRWTRVAEILRTR